VDDGSQNLGVGTMHAVKIADTHERRTKITGNLFEFSKELHLFCA